MTHRKLLLYLATLVLYVACSPSNEGSWQDNMDKITQLHCKATELRKARFALADSMRFYQDSLLELGEDDVGNSNKWKNALTAMEQRKVTLVDLSRDLADSIRVELLDLTLDMSVDEKRVFNDSLQARTERCE